MTLLAGANGSGKSTLTEAIAVACGLNPEGGGRNFAFETRGSHSPLGDVLRVSARGAPAEGPISSCAPSRYFNVASEIEALDREPSFGPPIIDFFGGVSLHEQSHGQSFIALLVHRFGPRRPVHPRRARGRALAAGPARDAARMFELVAEAASS